MAQADVDALHEAYKAFNRGDMEDVLRRMGPDVELHERPELADAASFSGREGVLQAFARTTEGFADYQIEPVEIIDADDHLIVHAHQRGRGRLSGAEVDDFLYHVWEFRDSRIVGLRAYTHREDALAAAGLAREPVDP